MQLQSLKDGTTVVLRELKVDDLERSLAFFRGLDADDRRYLRFDVTKRDVVGMLLRGAALGRACRIGAFVGDEIIAHGALELHETAWQRHVGEIRVIVGKDYRRQRLGVHMIRYLFDEAKKRSLAKVVVQVAKPQEGVLAACERIGFRVDAVLDDYVIDGEGNLQPMVVMSCATDEMSRTLRKFYQDENWPDG